MTTNTILEWLRRTIFARKLVDDNRSIEEDSLFSVEIPLPAGLFGEGGLDDSKAATICDFLPPDFGFYYQLIAVLLFQTIFNAILGSFLYKIVIEPQQRIKKSGSKNVRENEEGGNPSGDLADSGSDNPSSSGMAILFAFGIAIPFVVMEPIYAIRSLEIVNPCLSMIFLATPIINSLRITEAAFGFTPYPERRSLWNYVVYFSCTQGIIFDPVAEEPKRVSRQFLGKRLATLARDFVVCSVIVSMLQPYNYEFFDTNRDVHSMDHNLKELFSWQHLFNNYLVAFLLSAALSQGSIGVAVLYNIFYGFETYEMVLNPMLKSKSPSEFWGRRWNMMVHKGLKNGVYKPTRKQTSSRIAGVFATFVVSGIIHEYVNFVMFHDHSSTADGNIIAYRFRWKQMLFFGWNGILIALEYCIGHWGIFKWMSQNLPQIVVTALVICSALPLAHLFTGDWILHGFFDSLYLSEPVIRCHRVKNY